MPNFQMDSARIEAARTLLGEPQGSGARGSPWAALAAAGLAASSAVLLAGLMILGPGVSLGMSLDVPPSPEATQVRPF